MNIYLLANIVTNLKSVNNIFEKKLDIISRIGDVGKFMTMDLIDRIPAIESTEFKSSQND
jgi:hypothetical protein